MRDNLERPRENIPGIRHAIPAQCDRNAFPLDRNSATAGKDYHNMLFEERMLVIGTFVSL